MWDMAKCLSERVEKEEGREGLVAEMERKGRRMCGGGGGRG